ncbi:lysine 6-dehydrogenase [Cytobacillus oceanisediminis]|uniref:Lysine 6-dehydrogenase n=1 Tax=Cytobacillus oceanisediminis TaxID=665099 RepID=A0A2V3A7H1_9BACI|nr:saccharopine dehydrogenase C-terminal domain-containing protein [Cytobacillus oceanisediminis]PWW32131.1 lysine 6-dehydrogenase [Cytobacillus oceanisediminis]
MRAVVLGTGMIGTTVVSELAKFPGIKAVAAVDVNQNSVEKCLKIAGNPKVTGKKASLETVEDIKSVLKGADIAVACLPHSLSLAAIQAAIQEKCNLVDLVGSNFEEKIKLDQKAKDAGVIIVPGCGVAPGMTNFLAAQGIELLDEADEAVMTCGGIPRFPEPPLWYQVVFRLESVLGLYTRPALAAEDGALVELPPLSGLEKMTFPEPVGMCEAVVTDAHSTAYTLKDKVKRLYEKTVRYEGHWERMNFLSQLGFFDDEPVEINGALIRPRALSEKILAPKLQGKSKEDITVLRVEVNGRKGGTQTKYTWEMVDFYDHERNITSMAKTTALPAMLLANWIAEGKIKEKGIVAVEELIIKDRFAPFMEQLNDLGIRIEFKEEVLV